MAAKVVQGACEEGSLQLPYSTLVFLSLKTDHSFVNDALDCPPLFLDLPGHLVLHRRGYILGIKLYLLFLF